MPSLDDLLLATSRTFAACIPLLPEPTREEVRTAYLLFRIADTLEDAATWPRGERSAALGVLADLLLAPTPEAAATLASGWAARGPTAHVGYLELLRATPRVLDDLAAQRAAAREAIALHTRRTVLGMRRFVDRTSEDGRLALGSIDEVREYCYVVAGIVGELLTELFVLGTPGLAAEREGLGRAEVAFGEGLQLVNILKDEADDAPEGRRFVPQGARAALSALARADLIDAERYVHALARGGAPRGVVVFAGLPLLLARATLDRLEAHGPGAKIGRAVVAAALAHVTTAPIERDASALLAFSAPTAP